MPSIEIDYAYAMKDASPGGVPTETLRGADARWANARRRVLDRVESGELGFWRAPSDEATTAAMRAFVAKVPADIEDVLVLGIGGSSLGTRAVFQALRGQPELTYARAGRRVHLPDNSDPGFLVELLRLLDPKKTLALAVSKSGGTVETAAQLLVVREWLETKLGAAWKSHLAVVTDPTKGPLREIANEEGLASFGVPSNIGGRFSVLTPVGLLPAALAKLDVDAMLEGARQMAARCEGAELSKNPAGVLAVLHVLHHETAARNIHVLMPYADALRSFTAWYVQLWAESLGKRRSLTGATVETGPTPVPAIGATDQHAQMQLFMEGPRDKLVTFVSVADLGHDLTIPRAKGAFGYLGGHTMAGVLDAELRGTRLALARDGRPSITISIAKVDAWHLGSLFFLYEAATAYAGELYGVDAFDQPGVEEGKRLAFGLLGRSGYESAKAEVDEAERCRPTSYRV